MRQSQHALHEMAKSMSASLNTLGKIVYDGLGLLAVALNPQIRQMANQNTFGYGNNPPPPNNQHDMQGFYTHNFQSEKLPHVPQNQYPQQYMHMNASTPHIPTSKEAAGSLNNTRDQTSPPDGNISSPNYGRTYEQL